MANVGRRPSVGVYECRCFLFPPCVVPCQLVVCAVQSCDSAEAAAKNLGRGAGIALAGVPQPTLFLPWLRPNNTWLHKPVLQLGGWVAVLQSCQRQCCVVRRSHGDVWTAAPCCNTAHSQ
jgi:hypothetical protein